MTSTSTLKAFAYFLQIVCALLALVLISFAIYVFSAHTPNVNAKVVIGFYGFIGVTALILLLWGYLSTWRSNVCCTVTFTVFLVLIIIAHVGVLYLLITRVNEGGAQLANELDKAWEEELNNPGAMALYENWFHCCGRGSPQDYIVNERFPPKTCFKNQDMEDGNNLIDQGCRMLFESYWVGLLKGFNIVGGVLVACEIVLSIVSCTLSNSIRNDRRRTFY